MRYQVNLDIRDTIDNMNMFSNSFMLSVTVSRTNELKPLTIKIMKYETDMINKQ